MRATASPATIYRYVHARLWLLALMLCALWPMSSAHAANCYVATAQGATGPANWQTYCWVDFSTYNDTAARSAAGQNFTLTLQDGTTLAFNLTISGAAITPSASPTWSGAAIGNTAMTGIAGSPVLYQTAAGTTIATITAIKLTPPAGASGITSYMMIAADGESTNGGESLAFTTNGGAWTELDAAGPISGSTYPTLSGTGTTTVTETGVAGTVGAYIFGSSTPTQLTGTMVGSGLQGMMLAVRFASVRLTMQIGGARAAPADQFTYAINATSNGATMATGTSSGTTLGPFATAGVSAAASIPLTLAETMASGSTDTLAHYQTLLTCTNSNTGSPTVMPTNVATTSYALGQLAYGDSVACTYTATPYPHLTLTKALAASGRQYTGDQFAMNIAQGSTVLATTTTAGTGATLTNASTAQTQVSAASAYTLSEAGSGTTVLGQYTANIACTNANTTSTTTLPSGATARTITPAMGDVVACTITNTKIASNAQLTIAKTSAIVSDPVNGTTNPKFIPGAIIAYTFAVTNTGPAAVDSNTVWLIDTLPAQLSVGTAANPTFVQGSPTSGLTFTTSTDIRYSNATTAPASYAACTYTPTASYDPAVHYICLNPKGIMAGSTGTPPGFTLTIQAKVN